MWYSPSFLLYYMVSPLNQPFSYRSPIFFANKKYIWWTVVNIVFRLNWVTPSSNRYPLFDSWQLLQEQSKSKSTEKIKNIEPEPKLFGSLLKKVYLKSLFPVDTRPKLNVQKTFTSRLEHLMNVLSMFSLERVSCGLLYIYNTGI